MTTRRRFFTHTFGLASAASALAQVGWVYLGEANVDDKSDHDKIKVGKDRGMFRQIRLRVERAAIHFDRVRINYSGGEKADIAIAAIIQSGGQTRNIPVTGGRREIDGVEFWYARASTSKAKPRVRLYGYH